jgi:TonB family protein
VTDGTGQFRFSSVAGGTYVLEATLPGFRTLHNELVLATPRDWTRNITMQVGEVEETIRVTAKRPVQTVPLAQTASRANPVRVGGNIKQPNKLKDVPPVYPSALRDAGLEGLVPMDALIGRDGTVASVRVLSAEVHPEFARSAEEAVRQWVFSPTLLNNVPVEVQMAVSVQFRLED